MIPAWRISPPPVCRPAVHETRGAVIASASEAISSRSRLLRPRLPRRLRLLAMTRPSFVLVARRRNRRSGIGARIAPRIAPGVAFGTIRRGTWRARVRRPAGRTIGRGAGRRREARHRIAVRAHALGIHNVVLLLQR